MRAQANIVSNPTFSAAGCAYPTLWQGLKVLYAPSFDGGNLRSVRDFSGNGNHGTPTGLDIGLGDYGRQIQGDAGTTDDHIAWPGQGVPTELTWGGLFKMNNSTFNFIAYSAEDNVNFYAVIATGAGSTNDRIRAWVWDSDAGASPAMDYDDSNVQEYHSIFITSRNGDFSRLYVDGIVRASQVMGTINYSTSAGGGPVMFNGRGGSGNPADGNMAMFMYADRAYSAGEIAILGKNPFAFFEKAPEATATKAITITPVTFAEKIRETNPASMIFSITLNNSDITSTVLAYGVISRTAKNIFGNSFSMDVENASGTFNDIAENRDQVNDELVFDFGYATDAGSIGLVLYKGTLSSASPQQSIVTLNFSDRFNDIRNKTIGSEEGPVEFTSSENPADVLWTVLTVYGGLSDTEDDTNTDINYGSFSSWQTQLLNDSLLVKANFTGNTVGEAMETVRILTDSSIFVEKDNKISFARFDTFTGSETTLTDSWIIGINYDWVENDIVNKVSVGVGYDPADGSWTGLVTHENETSTGSYGIFEGGPYQDASVWYVDSSSALNLAQRLTFRGQKPYLNVRVETPLPILDRSLGDEFILTSSSVPITEMATAMSKYRVDMNVGKITAEFDEGIKLTGFILDDDYWGLLDQNYNPIL